MTWAQGSNVMIRRNGRKSVVGPGEHPTVTDNEGGQGAVSFESGGRVVVRVLGASGGPKRTIRVAGGGSSNGGITVYGSRRGIVTFFSGGDVYYFNEHSGNRTTWRTWMTTSSRWPRGHGPTSWPSAQAGTSSSST